MSISWTEIYFLPVSSTNSRQFRSPEPQLYLSEILNLEWHRVDFDRRVAWLDHGTTKNGEGRGIPLNNDAILALRAVEGNHGRWCFTYRKKRMERVGSGWKRALRRRLKGSEPFMWL